MGEESIAEMGRGCFMNIFLSGWFWVFVGFIALVVVVPLMMIDPGDVSTSQVEEQPTPIPTEYVEGWDLTNTSVNRDSACCPSAIVPLILVLAFVFKR